ncbi:uncharacterized protein LOC111617012 [Centruroides sculpturatus]|uniref:uncharacterized protein LOC111617012 n=1 Tax=Centruroides sculpturatus TaxID=218467 RepID=UPI000C6EE54C|nr:uncharacterized protein LOC111617012 [Centruroides sculpturatus]
MTQMISYYYLYMITARLIYQTILSVNCIYKLFQKISTNFRFSLKNKQNENEVKPSQINGKTNWKEKTLNSEILRLKDIINKLQEGNKKLMNQLKEKDQEIKSLRLQLAKAPGRNLLNRLQTKNEGEVKSTRDTVRNRPQNISNIKLEKIRPVVTNNLKGK